jgi:hypothetical protein
VLSSDVAEIQVCMHVIFIVSNVAKRNKHAVFDEGSAYILLAVIIV